MKPLKTFIATRIVVLSVLLINCSAAPMTALAREPAAGEFASVVYDPWLNGFPYRKPITITGSTVDQNNYQIKVAVSFVDGKMKTDFSDIRFTSFNGATLIDHWRESYTASSADFWVEVPSIPASPATTIIYMYYGNPAASSGSNGTNTFILFNDFEDNTYPDFYTYDGGTLILS